MGTLSPVAANRPKTKLNAKHVNISIAADAATGEVSARIAEKRPNLKSESLDSSNADLKEIGSDHEDGYIIPVKCLKCGAQLK